MSEQDKKKSYLSIFEEISKVQTTHKGQNGHPYPALREEVEESLVITDELDHKILMHRDAHFGGDFNVMLAYYQEDNIGTYPDFDFDRIIYLAEIEKELGQDLASLVLTGAEAEQVAKARQAYEKIKEIYALEEELSSFPRLLADLILTESEDPQDEIDAVVSQGKRIVPELLQIVKSEEAYDPLFPGYGYAPYLSILCLGKIKDPSSIIPLFETLGRDMVFEEEVILEALREIGEPAKQFLLDTLRGRPFTRDTINAAFALTAFADQSEVAIFCFQQLQDPEVQKKSLLRSYLLNNCEELRGTSYAQALSKMAQEPGLSADFRVEIETMTREW